MKAPRPTKMYDLELWHKLNGNYILQKKVVRNVPYPLCKGEKTKYEARKKHFEYLKIVPCQK